MMLHRHFEQERAAEAAKLDAKKAEKPVSEPVKADEAEAGKKTRGRQRKTSDAE